MKNIYLILLANVFTLSLFASHNRAGEIQYRQIGEKTIQAYIMTYTNPNSTPADRDSLLIEWGDGSDQWVLRSNGNGKGEVINVRNQNNIYIAEHTYQNFGEYTLVVDDRSRNNGIININNGNSAVISFYIDNTFTLSEEVNSSPQSLLQPIAVASVFTRFEFLATAYDDDGDLLTYRLVSPKMEGGLDVVNYQQVNDIGNNTTNQLTFNPITGLLIWDTPEIVGIYSIAIEVSSFRNGIENGRYIRDILIEVNNMPILSPFIDQSSLPLIGSIQEVTVGDTIQLSISANDQNGLAPMEAQSGLFNLTQKPALFDLTFADELEQNGDFLWVVDESHLRDEPYDLAIQVINEDLIATYYIISYKVNDIDTSIPFRSNDDLDIQIFPNPTQDYLTFQSKTFNMKSYQIFNMYGQLVSQGKLNTDRINVQALTSGTFIILIDKKYSFRFSKVDI